MTGITAEAAVFYGSYQPEALQRALDYAGDDGFVASMPQLLQARVGAAYDNAIWNVWFTSNSEENVVNTPAGNRALVVVHGGGIFAMPARFETLFRADVNRRCKTGFTGHFAGKITDKEAGDVLQGKLPDGSEMPVFPFDEFKRGIAGTLRRYAVVMDFETARKAKSGYHTFDDLKDDPLMIVRAGGTRAAAAYLDKVQSRHNTKLMGSWHDYAHIKPNEPQCSVVLLSGNRGGEGSEDDDDHIRGLDAEFGLRSGTSMINLARYVAVAPQEPRTLVRDLPFTG